MSDMNTCSFTGRLGRDAELRHTKAKGEPVLSVSLAVSGREKDAPPTWVSVSVFGKRAEALEPYLTKGSRIGVVGRISLREYESRDGAQRASLELVASDVTLLGEPRRDGEASTQSKPSAASPRPQPEVRQSTFDDPPAFDDNDVPF
jgi:single-strand DNA-binding protein